MDAALKAIAEPRRREILRLVWDRERAAGEIADHFDVTRPAVSQHLRVLREADLVLERRDGTRRLYHARRKTIDDLLTFLGEFWESRLDDLRDAAEHAEGARRHTRTSHDDPRSDDPRSDDPRSDDPRSDEET